MPYRDASEEEIQRWVDSLGVRPKNAQKDGSFTGGMLAARQLLNIGPKAVPALMEALDSEDATKRIGSIYTLAHMVHMPAIPKIAKLLDDPNHEVMEMAAQAFTMLKSPEAVDVLLEHAFTKHTVVRFKLLTSLGKQEDPRALPTLGQIAREDPESGIRRAAVHAIGEIKDPAGVEHLVPLLKDSDKEVRVNVVRSMGEIGGKVVEPHLIAALDDTYANVRREAVLGLNTVGGEAAISHLAELLERERKDYVKHSAVYTIGQLGDESHVDAIKSQATSSDVRLRETALRAMHRLLGAPPLEDVVPLLEDEDPHMRLFAAWTVGSTGTGDKKNAKLLLPLAEDEDDRVRFHVVMALGKFRDRSLLPAYARIIARETESDILRDAIFFSGLYLSKTIAYKEGKEEARSKEEVQMLYVPGENLLVPEYIRLLMHEEIRIREQAQKVLDDLSGMDLGYRFDSDEESRRAAQEKTREWWETRSQIGPDKWVRSKVEEAIEKLATDDPVERQVYADALRRITGQPIRLSLDSTAEQVEKAISRWKKWWEENRSKSRIEWLVAALSDEARPVEERMAIFVEIYWWYTTEPFDLGASSPPEKKQEAIGKFLEWYKEHGAEFPGEGQGEKP